MHRGEVAKLLAQIIDNYLSHDSVRKVTDGNEQYCANQCGDKRVGKRPHGERLHKHEHACGNDQRCQHFPGSTPKSQQPVKESTHFRTAPNVMPRSRCLRSSTVKINTGSRKIVAPAAMAGQSSPPTPMMVGMNGGAV